MSAPPPAGPGATNAFPAGIGSSSIDTVRVGDKLFVRFEDIPNPPMPMELRVRDDGTISLPLGISVQVAGKKLGDLEADIRNEYVPRYYNRMTVNLKVEERMIYVGGQVRTPGRYVFIGEMTLLGAIKVAGDFTEWAKKTQVQVTRSDGTRYVIDCKKALRDARHDIPVFPGDNIYVPQRHL